MTINSKYRFKAFTRGIRSLVYGLINSFKEVPAYLWLSHFFISYLYFLSGIAHRLSFIIFSLIATIDKVAILCGLKTIAYALKELGNEVRVEWCLPATEVMRSVRGSEK
ncbi:MAG TPA: hypothetical protein VK666_06775 [Chryseolinea sp.]|nr:hypothetical protein [Chryseolinea sp.]